MIYLNLRSDGSKERIGNKWTWGRVRNRLLKHFLMRAFLMREDSEQRADRSKGKRVFSHTLFLFLFVMILPFLFIFIFFAAAFPSYGKTANFHNWAWIAFIRRGHVLVELANRPNNFGPRPVITAVTEALWGPSYSISGNQDWASFSCWNGILGLSRIDNYKF